MLSLSGCCQTPYLSFSESFCDGCNHGGSNVEAVRTSTLSFFSSRHQDFGFTILASQIHQYSCAGSVSGPPSSLRLVPSCILALLTGIMFVARENQMGERFTPLWCNNSRGYSYPDAVVVVSNEFSGSAGDMMLYQLELVRLFETIWIYIHTFSLVSLMNPLNASGILTFLRCCVSGLIYQLNYSWWRRCWVSTGRAEVLVPVDLSCDVA